MDGVSCPLTRLLDRHRRGQSLPSTTTRGHTPSGDGRASRKNARRRQARVKRRRLDGFPSTMSFTIRKAEVRGSRRVALPQGVARHGRDAVTHSHTRAAFHHSTPPAPRPMPSDPYQLTGERHSQDPEHQLALPPRKLHPQVSRRPPHAHAPPNAGAAHRFVPTKQCLRQAPRARIWQGSGCHTRGVCGQRCGCTQVARPRLCATFYSAQMS